MQTLQKRLQQNGNHHSLNQKSSRMQSSSESSSPPVVPLHDLPVIEAKTAIIQMARNNNALIIVGETGSGKTTQIPQFILDHVCCHTPNLILGCTQPRRVAAISISRYVASQRNCKVGEEVGYSVRFDDKCSSRTRLKFMTDGILLREILADRTLSKYGAIVLDEAHERTLHGDVLFGLLKALTAVRRDLKIIIMSATLNAKHFSEFWRNAPIGVVHGRSFPVTVMHSIEPQADYVDAAISTIIQIHTTEPPGDVLCFLTGQEEIEDAKRVLEKWSKFIVNTVPDFVVYTIYAAMPYEKQLLVFEPAPKGQRKIILATNIAETSITIEGIKYVVDSGMVKSKSFNPKTNMESLQEVPISKAQALQRTGRAGRMSAGKCYRLFTQESFEELPDETVPEIKRCSLNSIVLQMKAMGIADPLSFEFMDMPSPAVIVKAQEVLLLLGALDPTSLLITSHGRQLAEFPIEPQAAKTILAAKAMGVAAEVITVLALLSTENIFITSKAGQDGVDKCRNLFKKSAGDHVTLLHIYHSYNSQVSKREWCESHSVNHRQMLRAEDIMTQLNGILSQIPADSLLTNGAKVRSTNSENFTDYEKLRMAFCVGFFLNTAFYDAKLMGYRSAINHQPLHLHPSSVLNSMTKKKPQLVLYNSVVRTSRNYMKDVIIVREEWLLEAAPQFFKPSNNM